jgi:hypothetical protein
MSRTPARDTIAAVFRDDPTEEKFLRIVGRRTQQPIGQPPRREAREALAQMARYRTRCPKGVFVYRNHEDANADRLRWTVDAVVSRHQARR